MEMTGKEIKELQDYSYNYGMLVGFLLGCGIISIIIGVIEIIQGI